MKHLPVLVLSLWSAGPRLAQPGLTGVLGVLAAWARKGQPFVPRVMLGRASLGPTLHFVALFRTLIEMNGDILFFLLPKGRPGSH